MQKITTGAIMILLVMSFMDIPVFAQEINSEITSDENIDKKVVTVPLSDTVKEKIKSKPAEFKFIYKEKEVVIPIYSDFKVEDKKLYLLDNNKPYNLKISPLEVYSAVYDLTVKEPEVVVKELSIGIEDEKAVYNLRVEEPAKILWIIPWTVESKYLIDPADGSVKLVGSPWYITNEKVRGSENWHIFIQPD